jgi:TetR/AcrR family transcriptional regulator, transcriptional repressor for nem operon
MDRGEFKVKPMSRIKERLTLTDLLTRDDVLEGIPTKDTLLAHGVRLFHRHGVHGTSIGRLLSETGKSKSQFYFHFQDKDDFVCHVLELEMTTMLKMKKRFRLDRVEDVVDWFSPYLELASLPGNLGCPVGPVATELSPSKESIRAEAERQFRRWEQKITDDLVLLAAGERFDESFDPRAVARNLACSIQGAFLLGRVFQERDFIVEVRDRFQSELERWRKLS